jgi:hypothetical protein
MVAGRALPASGTAVCPATASVRAGRTAGRHLPGRCRVARLAAPGSVGKASAQAAAVGQRHRPAPGSGRPSGIRGTIPPVRDLTATSKDGRGASRPPTVVGRTQAACGRIMTAEEAVRSAPVHSVHPATASRLATPLPTASGRTRQAASGEDGETVGVTANALRAGTTVPGRSAAPTSAGNRAGGRVPSAEETRAALTDVTGAPSSRTAGASGAAATTTGSGPTAGSGSVTDPRPFLEVIGRKVAAGRSGPNWASAATRPRRAGRARYRPAGLADSRWHRVRRMSRFGGRLTPRRRTCRTRVLQKTPTTLPPSRFRSSCQAG